MSEHRFTVYVGVNLRQDIDDERTEAGVAEAYLNGRASTQLLSNLDGFVDLDGEVWMGAVEYEESHD